MAGFPWEAVIAGGSQVLSGLLGGGNSAGHERRANYNMTTRLAKNMPKVLVEGAQEAGIHPLVALGMNPASGGFAQSVMGQPSTGDVVGSALGAAVTGYQNQRAREADAEALDDAKFQRILDQQSQIARDQQAEKLTAAQIRNLDADTAARLAAATSRSTIANARAVATGGAQIKKELTDVFGNNWPADQTPAQDWQNQFGEPGEYIFGGLNLVDSFTRGVDTQVKSADAKLNAWLRKQKWKNARRSPSRVVR